jgi:ribosomal protein L16 Arg81 hydroxylase
MMTNRFDLAKLLFPITPEQFFQEYWEQQPLVLPRKKPGYYQELFSVQDIDSVLLHSKPHPPDIRVVANQQELLPSKYLKEDGGLNLNQLYKAYNDGHTIVINGLQRFWQPLALFCNHVQDFLNHGVVANLYFSPKQSKGLHPHYDTHDVFVLQVDGSKQWEVHKPTQPVPFLNSFQPVIPEKTLGEPLYSLCLEPGDLLYMPRGFIHHAATADTFSLHLTLGIYPNQWFDLIVNALTALAMRDVRFRKALPVGFLDHPEQFGELQCHLQELTQILADKGKVEEALSLLYDRQIRQTIPLADGQFAQLNQLDSITPNSRVAKRSGLRCRTIDQLFSMSLQFPGNTINFPYSHRPALEFIETATEPFIAQALPNLDPDQQVTLVSRLIKGGLLQIVPIDD